jgi:DNA-directed RNA polymerase subunit RPC12/RpoP
MPWKCPACETQIRHDGDAPQANRVYRCPVCRLELTLDTRSNRMAVPPLPDTSEILPADRAARKRPT